MANRVLEVQPSQTMHELLWLRPPEGPVQTKKEDCAQSAAPALTVTESARAKLKSA